ncbi:MAG: hypothetical protein ABIN96_00035 [Rubrivivax sp.]
MRRRDATFVRLPMPGVVRRQLAGALRLQLTQYQHGGLFGFVWRQQQDGMVAAWMWPIDSAVHSPRQRGAWAEPALEAPGSGLRIVRRQDGAEGQCWSPTGDLTHSRFFADGATDAGWLAFVRGCGLDPDAHPLPAAVDAAPLPRGNVRWQPADNLPAADPWKGWGWKAALVALGAVVAAGAGAHLQARRQLQEENDRLQALKGGRESSLLARATYQRAATELGALRRLVPATSQLELLARVAESGVFERLATSGAPVANLAPGSPAATDTAVRLREWAYTDGQLKMTLALPGNNALPLLQVTRRLESVPGLGPLQVGQEGAGNSIALSTRVVAEPSPGRLLNPGR